MSRNNNLKVLNLAVAVVAILRASDHDCVVAGGAARDSAHDVSFKDVDIIVRSADIGLYSLLQLIGFTCYEDNEYQNEEDCGRIRSVWKNQGLEGIDVIVYNHDMFKSLEDCVLHGFDCNMNQYVMLTDIPDSWSIMTLHRGEKVVKLLRDDVSIKRMERLVEVAERIGWDSTELQQCVTETKEREDRVPTFG